MAFRFGDFELDEACRELRFRQQPLLLQPRVFDLLALLIRNRDRVVNKHELLERLWPDTIVGDGSLQRAVSLARSALRHGGLESTIRNYNRQGYRFCFDDPVIETDAVGAIGATTPRIDAAASGVAVPGVAATESDHETTADGRKTSASAVDPLTEAQRAFERCDWEVAVQRFAEADRIKALSAADLERLAEAQECAGRSHEALPLLERAVAAFAARGDSVSAARSALRLANMEIDLGRFAVASGWRKHGTRYLSGIDERWEHGFAAYVRSRVAMAHSDMQMTAEAAAEAIEIGKRLGSEDIEALGRLYLGYAELAMGRIAEGLVLMDEAAAMIIGGNVSPWVGATLYCGLIWVCCNRGDWQRASQWNDSFARWCERGRLSQFSGLCQLHRAEVMCVSGKVGEAEAEIARAREELARHTPWAEGDAYRILGELRLLSGDLDSAEAAFRSAHERGWDPQPGLAMLMAERGDAKSAIRALLRALEDPNWALQHRRVLLLAQLAIIAARHGHDGEARRALSELDAKPELYVSEAHTAVVNQARAEVAAQQGDLSDAVAKMREAVRHWQQVASGLALASARLRLAELLAADRDVPAALLELDAARTCFEARHAPVRVGQCIELRGSLEAR